jgi:hypothetical protein
VYQVVVETGQTVLRALSLTSRHGLLQSTPRAA